MKIRMKIMILFILVAIVGGGANSYFMISKSQAELKHEIGESSANIAKELLNKIDREINNRIGELNSYAIGIELTNELTESNKQFDELENREEFIAEKDTLWTSIPKGETNAFVQKILDSKNSQELKNKADFYYTLYNRPVFGEIFVTNKYGANVAQTKITSDYYQADEEWWQKAKADGIYLSDVLYDESADLYAIDIAIRLDSKKGDFIGVVKTSLSIEELVSIVREFESDAKDGKYMVHENHQTMEYKLLTKDLRVIYSTEKYAVLDSLQNILPPEIANHSIEKSYLISNGDAIGEGEELFAFAHSNGYRNNPGLGWIVVIEHNTEETFNSIKELRKTLIFISGILILATLAVGFIFSKSISKPIIELKERATKVGKGELEIKEITPTNDEIGELAKSFNKMALNLKSYQDKLIKSEKERTKELEKEVSKKTSDLNKYVSSLEKTRTATLNILEDLDDTNKHLKDLDKAKSDFLNIVSHELKTPLTAMFAYLDIIEDLDQNFTPDELKAIDAIRRNSRQLKNLINNILEISRIEAGKFEIINSDVDPVQKIKDVIENLKPLAENKKIKLISKVDPKLNKMVTDEQRLEEILNNLISNAIKFTENGTITITGSVKGQDAIFSVDDTGVGIPEEKKKEMFQKFYQVDASISRKYGGTGLGLSITKQLIELQNGKIWFESKKGKGTTFFFTLPLKGAKTKKIDEK